MAIADATLLTLASAWGIATSLENLGIPLEIKWPNDLVRNGFKVGGILTETRIGSGADAVKDEPGPKIQFAVIGVGLNWDNPLPSNAVSVRQLLPDQESSNVNTLEDLAAVALRGILQGYYFAHQQGSAALIEVYQHKLSHLGKIMTVDGHTAQVKGVTDTGRLAIEIIHESGQKTIESLKPGEISLGYNG
jgi:BirA family biotin operon repressor/biotin-[acetyl-CoA-carboxylase] ligase